MILAGFKRKCRCGRPVTIAGCITFKLKRDAWTPKERYTISCDKCFKELLCDLS